MQSLQTRKEMELWRQCDDEPSQKPRYAVSEWLGCASLVNNRKAVSPVANYQQGSRRMKVNVVRTIGQIKSDRRACDYGALWSSIKHKMDLCEFKITKPSSTDHVVFVWGSEPQAVQEFNKRAERWRIDTSFQSSLAAKFLHEDYQTIMAMGEPVIPLILERLKTRHEEWFWALKHLAKGKDAAKQADNPTDAAKAWLRWGKRKGYIE